MKDLELVKELARRTSVSEETAAEVLHAAQDLLHEEAMDSANIPLPPAAIARPDDPSVVERLIARAKKHPLGIEFLVSGFLATVAITLGAHAFTVEAARRRLQTEQLSKEETPK